MHLHVRVYIVKAVIFNPIRENGTCFPYLSFNIGERLIEDTKNVKSTIDPVFGSVYEFEAKFPYESQLTISIKDWDVMSNRSLIGQTKIDLEDRYYSNCYATCGISKRFDQQGYNAWRDLLTPKKILIKLCKKWRLKRPEFTENKLTIVTLLGQQKEYVMNDPSHFKSIIQQQKKLVNQVSVTSAMSSTNEAIGEIHSTTSVNLIEEKLALYALNDWESITGVSLYS